VTLFAAIEQALLDWLAGALSDRLVPRPPRPDRFSLRVTEEISMTGFKVLAHLPTPPRIGDPNFLASQALVVTVDTVAGDPVILPLTALEAEIGVYPVGKAIVVTLTYVDQSGNESVPRAAEIVIVDTVAPPQPGEFGLSVTEVEIPDVEPTTPPTF
jgi:hypothetical protein